VPDKLEIVLHSHVHTLITSPQPFGFEEWSITILCVITVTRTVPKIATTISSVHPQHTTLIQISTPPSNGAKKLLPDTIHRSAITHYCHVPFQMERVWDCGILALMDVGSQVDVGFEELHPLS